MRSKVLQALIALLVLSGLVVFNNNYQASVDTNYLKVSVLDIGQGDSILFDTPDHHQVLIDGGPDSTVLNRLGQALPLSDKELDLIIVTHNHSDHLAGINEVLKHYKVDKIWVSGAIHTTDTYLEFLKLIKDKNIPIETVTAGKDVAFGQLHGVVLYPLTDQTGKLPENQHDANVVTYWQYGQETLLMTGDAEMPHEQEMLAKGLIKPATILKVGHHGSYTSTSEALLKAAQPKIAVISVGANNKFGHPHQVTLDRLKSFGIPVLRTDQKGTIKFLITENSFTYQTTK